MLDATPMKRTSKRLELRSDTLRALTPRQLSQVNGGEPSTVGWRCLTSSIDMETLPAGTCSSHDLTGRTP